MAAKKYIIIKNGIVDNFILAEANFIDQMGWQAVEFDPDTHIGIDIGDSYLDGVFYVTPRQVPVPQNVTPFQFQNALLNVGKYSNFESLISQNGYEQIRISINTSQALDKDSDLVTQILNELEILDKDEFFKIAGSL